MSDSNDYHQITLSEWSELKDRLRREMNDLRTSFVRVGYILRKMDDSRAYEAEGYKSVAEFALKVHGLKPSITSRWMAINREYSVDGYSEQLDPRYIDMNASQLAEMLTLEQKDRELITPQTPRADIRELKRFNADAAAAGDVPDRGEKTPAEKAFENLLSTDQQTAAAVRNCIENGLTDPDHLFEAVAPSGSRMFRFGTVFLVFNAFNIMVKVFGGESKSESYENFTWIASRWFEEHGEPENQEQEPSHEEPADAPAELEPEEEPAETAEAEPEPEEKPKTEKPVRKEPAKKESRFRESDRSVDMNPPDVAPAQKSEEVIVDEAGNPAPEDPEEAERKRLEQVEIHRNNVEMLRVSLNTQINSMNWPDAQETAEQLLASLTWLRVNDSEAIDALVQRFLHGE